MEFLNEFAVGFVPMILNSIDLIKTRYDNDNSIEQFLELNDKVLCDDEEDESQIILEVDQGFYNLMESSRKRRETQKIKSQPKPKSFETSNKLEKNKKSLSNKIEYSSQAESEI
ncbi:hypothetical protein HZS_3057, partial [Henneguya salminicola]